MKQLARLSELDALRGLAALGVVIHHNLAATGATETAFGKLLFSSPLQILAKGRPAVMFFFVLSGFVLTRALRSHEGRMTARRWAAWSLQRSIRLLGPVAAALLVSAGLYWMFYAGVWPGESIWLQRSIWMAAPTPAGLIGQALLVRSTYNYPLDSVLWSLAHEWRISLLLPALAAMAMLRGTGAALVLLFLGLAAAGLAANPWDSAPYLEPGLVGSIRSSVYFILPFAIGAALDRADIATMPAGRWQFWAGALAMAALARMNNDLSDYMASAILIWLALQPGPLQRALRSPVLQWLGRISFSLYLTHELVLAPIYHQLHPWIAPAGLATLSVVLALPAAHLFYLGVERRMHRLARAAWSRFGETPADQASLSSSARLRATPQR